MVKNNVRRNSKGLESLKQMDSVFIRQKKTKSGTNSYQVLDNEDQALFTMLEVPFPDASVRVHAKVRGFSMNVFDMHQNKVFSFHRTRTFKNEQDNIQVYLQGCLVSTVHEVKKTCSLKPRLAVSDVNGNMMYRMKGDMLCNNCQIQTPAKSIVGSMEKKFTSVLKELFTNRDNYVIAFPPNCSLEHKVSFICATVLIDYKYHED